MAKHTTRDSGAIGHHSLNIISCSVYQRTTERRAFRGRPSTSDNVESSRKLGWGQWQDRWIILRLAIDMLLPAGFCISGTVRLPGGHHSVGIVKYRCVGLEPVGRCLASQRNQPTITRSQIY